MAAPNKQRLLNKILTQLAKAYSIDLPENLSVLDHLLLGAVQEETSLSRGIESYRRLIRSFHDLNEIRVSHSAEIEEILADVPEPQAKARRILQILQFVFETTYTFDLESMRRKPLKQAQKQLSKIAGANDFIVAASVQRALGGHALPVDRPMCQVLTCVDLIESAVPEESRGPLEHLVPKAKGLPFCSLVSELAADHEQRVELMLAINPKAKGLDELATVAVAAVPVSKKSPRKAQRKKSG